MVFGHKRLLSLPDCSQRKFAGQQRPDFALFDIPHQVTEKAGRQDRGPLELEILQIQLAKIEGDDRAGDSAGCECACEGAISAR